MWQSPTLTEPSISGPVPQAPTSAPAPTSPAPKPTIDRQRKAYHRCRKDGGHNFETAYTTHYRPVASAFLVVRPGSGCAVNKAVKG